MTCHATIPYTQYHQWIGHQIVPTLKIIFRDLVEQNIAKPSSKKHAKKGSISDEVRNFFFRQHPKLFARLPSQQVVTEHKRQQVAQAIPAQLDGTDHIKNDRIHIVNVSC